MILKQNKIFVLFLTIFIFGIVSFLTFTHNVTANVITVDDPTGDDVDNGLCSIVEAVINHNNADQSGSIDCIAGVGESDIISIETNIVLDTSLGVDGSSTAYAVPFTKNIIINGNGNTIERDTLASSFRIFSFSGFGNVEINDLTIKGGSIDGSGSGFGGGIYISSLGSVSLNNVTLDSNTATEGGGLYATVDSSPALNLNLDSVSFVNNSVSNEGGAMSLKNNSNNLNVVIDGSTFDSNTSSSLGGGIFGINVTDLEVSETYFTQNNTSGGGTGGVFYLDGNTSALVSDSYFYFNRPSTTRGGVFYTTEDVYLEVNNSTFENSVAGSGGIFYLYNGSELVVYNSTFYTNVAIDSGGVVYSYQDAAADPNQINFYHNAEDGSFAGEDSSAFFFNCIYDGSFCITNSDPGDVNLFSGETYIFENNIFFTDGCDGNIENISYENNISSFSTCGVPVATPTNISEDLAENGGLWKTLKVSLGSSAIDTAVNATLGCPSADGRGVPRPFGSACDIGPYEFTGIAEVVIEETSGGTSISEPDGEDTYTIVLGEAPTSSVTIDIEETSSDFDVSPSSVTFTTLNWFNPRTITVSAIDNNDDDGDRTGSISHVLDTSDVVYELVSMDSVSVNIADEDSSGGSTTSSGSGPRPPRTSGCTDETALNYNSFATTDDGSCDYFVWIYFGCDDPSATNYDVRVTNNNGTCIYPASPVPGCTNSSALNYNSSATEDDGSCSYAPMPAPVFGCTDSSAQNFNSLADTDDGSCEYEDVLVPEIPEENLPVVNLPVTPPSTPPTVPVTIPETVTALDMALEVLSGLFKNISGILGVMIENISENALQYAAATGVLAPIVIFLLTNPATLVTVPVRIWTAIPTLLGIRRKKRPWGTVYDSVTKQPLDPVYLVLEDVYGNQVSSTISDIDGRFGFIASPGKYRIRANKDGYRFPSNKMLGKNKDELYENLYFNEFIEITREDDLLIKNIPMDSLTFNWNEFEKSRNRKLMKFFSKTDLFLSGISDLLFILGAIFSLFLLLKSFSVINIVIVAIYVVITLFKIFGIGPKKPGYVIKKENNDPLSLGLIKIFSSNTGTEVSHCIVGKTGRYHALVPKGEYFIEISEKIGEDLYKPIYTSGSMKIKKGYLANVFKV